MAEQMQEIKDKMIRYLNRGWTQKRYARNKFGDPVQIGDKNASCFCIKGALLKVKSDLSEDYSPALLEVESLLNIKARTICNEIITWWNDFVCQSKEEAIKFVEEALA